MNAASGVARSVARHAQLDGVYGAIDTREDMLIQTGRFHFWFEASFEQGGEFPLSFLLAHQDAIEFEGLDDNYVLRFERPRAR